jgi:phosphate transport system substrate-binding protein
VIAPQNSREAVVRWQLTEAQKRDAKQQGGKDFALRLYDVTGINPESEVLENFYQYDCNELSQELRIEIPVPSRDYVVEVGYADHGSEWYGIVRSHSVHIPSA